MKKLYVFLLATLGLLMGCSNGSSTSYLLKSAEKSSQKTLNKSSHKTSSRLSSSEGMVRIAPNIYVDPEMSATKHQQFLQVVKQSKSSISSFFGGMQSNPGIYACTTKPCFRKFGGIPAKAKAIGDDKVLLSLEALNKVTLTHELAHVELHKRLGSAHVWNKVPMWFDEGLAVLACKDPEYSKPVKRMSLNKLTTQNQWVSAVRGRIPAYNIARQAVQKWYNTAGSRGLQTMIGHMKRGESFTSSLSLSSELRISRL